MSAATLTPDQEIWRPRYGASNDQSTWVLTSYLVSNAIILPISGWLASTLGRK